jgi:molybdopterin/thiamine biosynthesis adenylyltransferase
MLANPTAPNADVQALIDDGFSVVIVDDRYLIVENVPYCPAAGRVAYGDIISPFSVVSGVSQLNNDHTVWFTGSIPHTAQGASLRDALVAEVTETLTADRKSLCRLSNKPDKAEDLARLLQSFHVKMLHYVNKLSRHARDVDPLARADYRGRLQVNARPSVFFYPNTAIARSGLDAYEDKLRQRKVAIIGVGGTGSYILDALAKTPIEEIYIYDGDEVEAHNCYRMPGVLKPGEAFSGIAKAEHLANHYGQMRKGIVGRSVRVDEQNIAELFDCSFVFIAIDHGPSRGLIASYLVARGIPFIDVGIGVDKVPAKVQLHARARVTLVTPQTADLVATLPTSDDTEKAEYDNIQLVELNALNAMLAVVRYKQFLGFYTDEAEAETIKYKASWCELLVSKRIPE